MKMRTRSIVMLAAVLLLTAIVVLPRVIEAGRSKASTGEKAVTVTPLVTNRSGQDKKDTVTVGASIHNDTSPPLRDMKQEKVAKKAEKEANENPKVPATLKHSDSPDAATQQTSPFISQFAPNMPSPLLNFDGVPFPGVGCNCAPPDTDGEVGATQFVQIVNEGYQVFDKTTGASQLGPAGITTLWGGFGGVCQNNGNGDPVVLYDQLANRWIISQFATIFISAQTSSIILMSVSGPMPTT
jgi:hypothetical protein